MAMRGVGAIGVAMACLTLAACGDRAGSKTEASSAEAIAAALDICEGEGAQGAFARNVCENRQLAAIDGQIREALVAESANVSDAGAQMLVQNQTRWREAARVSCGLLDAETAPTLEQQSCLEQQFRARLEDAQHAVQEVGGYTFQRMELVDAAPVTAQIAEASGLGDSAPVAIVRDIRFPRIDGQQTAAIQRFNDIVARQPQRSLSDATNEVVDYQIVFAGPELISVRFISSEDTLGAAHPNNSVNAVTVLMSEGRELTASDVFRADSGWEDFLTRRAVASITRDFADYAFNPPERDVRETATKPHLWLVSDSGLTVLFPPYSFGGPHALGGTEVTIPWAELREYLNPAAPAPIRPSA
ncbi:MAG TPA: RsiV family protein [Terricaulis sp.]|nr:RsiV family protein [Terricaulis sp.]